ncbi:hypothetical protein V5F38_05370 [Xanthobacter sp. V0B-10]|uniref:hypothetical protein n=1 Tax=Xanthobacter albus TaxID=3119929 RepID=UPI00372828E2
MSSEMVERIARAIYSANRRTGTWEGLSLYKKERHRAEALAVLKAMREPTFGMRDAATRRQQGPDDCLYGSVFTAMIDHEIKLAEGGANDR